MRKEEYFYTAQLINRVHDALVARTWWDCPKNVFSNRLNREYDKSAFRKSDCKLCSKLLLQQVQKSCIRNSWMFGGHQSPCLWTQLSCANVGDQLAIIGQVHDQTRTSFKYTISTDIGPTAKDVSPNLGLQQENKLVH